LQARTDLKAKKVPKVYKVLVEQLANKVHVG
jgi:hypothetical protein